MGEISLIHWILVAGVVIVLFGAGKLPNVMGDIGKGIRAFRTGMDHKDAPAKDDESANR